MCINIYHKSTDAQNICLIEIILCLHRYSYRTCKWVGSGFQQINSRCLSSSELHIQQMYTEEQLNKGQLALWKLRTLREPKVTCKWREQQFDKISIFDRGTIIKSKIGKLEDLSAFNRGYICGDCRIVHSIIEVVKIFRFSRTSLLNVYHEQMD